MKIAVALKGVEADGNGTGHPYELAYDLKEDETVEHLVERLLVKKSPIDPTVKCNWSFKYGAHIELRIINEN